MQVIRIIAFFVWTCLIIMLSTRANLPSSAGLVQVPGIDKIGHAGAYFIWSLLAFWVLSGRKRSTWMVILLATALGIGLEYVQLLFFPTRFFEVLDILSNIIGALSSLLVKRFLTP